MLQFFIRTLCVLVLCASANLVHANTPARIALLIGNQTYNKEVGLLKNPHNDVDLVAASLRKLGFEIQVLKDASYRTMDIAIRRHVDRVRLAGRDAIGFFYYSGHGVANPDTKQNFLIPVDVTSAEDSDIWLQSFQQNEIINRLAKLAGNATHFVVLDSCRNELNLTGPSAKALGTNKGFLPVAKNEGILVAYATAPGQIASDQGDYSGPYADALATELLKPGVEAVTMFRNVQIRVKQATGQDPWLSFPALPAVYLAGRVVDQSTSSNASSAQGGQSPSSSYLRQAERAFWDWVKKSQDPKIVRSYLEQYPQGLFAQDARKLADALSGRQLAALPSPKTDDDGDLTTSVQQQLKNMNCYVGTVDGNWGPGSRRALRRALGDNWASEGPTRDVLEKLKQAPAAACKRVTTKIKRTPTKKPRQTRKPSPASSQTSSCLQDCKQAGGRACHVACRF